MIGRVLVTILITQALVGLVTGTLIEETFGDLEPPEDFLDWPLFISAIVATIFQMLVAAITWSFIPGLPTVARVIAGSATGLLVGIFVFENWSWRIIILAIVGLVATLIDTIAGLVFF